MFEVAIGIGVIISLFFLEAYGAAAGGIVVCGYIALYLNEPLTIAITLCISFIVYVVVKLLGTMIFVYGRRRMVFSVLLGFIFGWIVRTYVFPAYLAENQAVHVIGYIIPGLIANSMVKQGIIKTLTIMGVAAVLVRFILVLVFQGKFVG
ncbi:MAG: poly-gamma-glutamate biosynthesis protein PgsC [Candidatus Cloacimonetes bacterium]|nr:poly-gamma-glutamate biosynthesis protein PgsC [Candidatus Cloacimonadota bacterium]MBL7108270.1 poly-gamma-glutamate biosynthesis protein PgsC [Candidatus Cloacimonadota bacterium]